MAPDRRPVGPAGNVRGGGALFDGTFTQELVDVCAGGSNVVAILHESGTARGQRFDNLAL